MTNFKKYNLRVDSAELHFKGPEHGWAPNAITEKNRKTEMILALNWLNYICTDKDARRFLEDWIRCFRPETAKADLAILHKTPDRYIKTTPCHLARIAVQGFPLTEQEHMQIWEMIILAHGRSKGENALVEEPTTPEQPKIGVQERIDRQVGDVVFGIEETMASILRIKGATGDANKAFGSNKLSPIHFKKLAKRLENLIAEFRELRDVRAKKKLTDKESQLIEGYAWLGVRPLKTAIEFVEACISQANQMAAANKVAQVRKKKPMDKGKLVRNFKFQTALDKPKINSIQPVACLSSTEVWVYNTKTRKLGVYKGEFDGSIMIKGNKFINIMKTTSVQKTLRKPEVQLAEFQALAKNQLRKWFDKIKGVEHRLNGRGTEQTLLLRAI